MTNIFSRRPILFESIDFYNRDYQVLWLINADIIKGRSIDSKFARANHFVALAGDFKPPESEMLPVKVPIFTWGKIMNIPEWGDMPLKDFLSGFFGYVVGRL